MMIFSVSDEELKAARTFADEHEAIHGPSKAVDGARYTYEFTPGGMGTSIWIRCSCKDAVDITDYSAW